MRIAYVTAGTHGAGHVVRGLALERALERAATATGRTAAFGMFCPATPFQARLAPDAITYPAQPALWRERGDADRSALAEALAAWRPDHIVIDLFWVPLANMRLQAPATLLLRSVPAAWLRGPVEARFDPGRYDRIWAIEPAPGLDRFDESGPVIYEDRALTGSREALVALGRFQDDRPLVVVARAGIDADRELLEHHVPAHEANIVRLDLADPGNALFPISHHLRFLRDGDRLISAAGYNAFWEAHYFGYAPMATWVAGPRVIDDQRWRSGLAPGRVPGNGADSIASALLGRPA